MQGERELWLYCSSCDWGSLASDVDVEVISKGGVVKCDVCGGLVVVDVFDGD